MTEIRVAVIDDHPIFRAGVTCTLCAQPDINVIAEGCSSSDAVRLAQQSRPDIMILDLHIPGGGINAIEALVGLCPDVKPLMLSGSVVAEQIRTAMQKGAWGYLYEGGQRD